MALAAVRGRTHLQCRWNGRRRGGQGRPAGVPSILQCFLTLPIGSWRRRLCHCHVVLDVGVINVVEVGCTEVPKAHGSAPGRMKATEPSPGMPRSAAYTWLKQDRLPPPPPSRTHPPRGSS